MKPADLMKFWPVVIFLIGLIASVAVAGQKMKTYEESFISQQEINQKLSEWQQVQDEQLVEYRIEQKAQKEITAAQVDALKYIVEELKK